MSFLISDEISNLNQELNIVGQRVSDSDYLLFFNRANKYFYTNYKMPTTQRTQDYLIFSKVNEYSLPADFVGLGELERPYDIASISPDNYLHTTQREFTHYLHGNLTAFKFDKETSLLLVNYDGGTNAVVHDCNTYNENGTWAAGGDASNVMTDEQYFTEGTGSVRFTVTNNTGTSTLTITDMEAVDLTDFKDYGFLFLDLFNSTSTNITSVTVKIGSGAGDYYQMSATTRYNGASIGNSFGQLGFDFSTKTTVGSPTVTACNYIQVSISGAATGTYRLDNIFVALGEYFKLPYYSKYNVKNSGGTYQSEVTATDDTILCPWEFNEAYTYKVGEFAAMLKLQDPNEANYFRGELLPKELGLRAKFPKQESRTQTSYYKRAENF